MELKRGLIQLYRGDGKGKTSAAIGACVRFVGAGGAVAVAQFLKSGGSSERPALEKLGVVFLEEVMPLKFVHQMNASELGECRSRQTALLRRAVEFGQSGGCGMLVLDEVLDAVQLGMLDEDEFVCFLDRKPKHLELILTGHQPCAAVEERADYISEVRALRHPYENGEAARRGIEF